MAIIIEDIKVVSFCSKHGGKERDRFGKIIPDKDIYCLECDTVRKNETK